MRIWITLDRNVVWVQDLHHSTSLVEAASSGRTCILLCWLLPLLRPQSAPFHPPLFGAALEEVMELQKDSHPELGIPWVVGALCDIVLSLQGPQTEGIFRWVSSPWSLSVCLFACLSTNNIPAVQFKISFTAICIQHFGLWAFFILSVCLFVCLCLISELQLYPQMVGRPAISAYWDDTQAWAYMYVVQWWPQSFIQLSENLWEPKSCDFCTLHLDIKLHILCICI